MNCEFCKQEFSSKRSLKIHQTTAQYCLKLQGKEEEILKVRENNKCPKCSICFSSTSNLKKHTGKCLSVSQTAQIINNNDNSNNLTVNLNIYGSTLSSGELITQIQQKLVSLLIPAVPNLPEMCRIAARNFTNENGNSLIAVSDASRNKFIMRYDNGDVSDHGGYKTCSMIRPPMLEASIEVYSKNDSGDSGDTLKLITDMKENDKSIVDNLVKNFPSSLDTLHPDECKMLETNMLKINKLEQRFEQVRKIHEKKKEQKKAIEDGENFDKFLDDCKKYNGNLYTHKKYGYMVEMISSSEFNIQCKRRPNSETDLDLTDADLKNLCELGMRQYIDSRYELKLKNI